MDNWNSEFVDKWPLPMPMNDGRKKNVDVPDSKRNNVNGMRFTSFTFMKRTDEQTNEETKSRTTRDALAFGANIR